MSREDETIRKMQAIIEDLREALRETLEIAFRNEAGLHIRRALDAIAIKAAEGLVADRREVPR